MGVMVNSGELAAFGILLKGGRFVLVLQLNARDTKYNARRRLELVYSKHAPGWDAAGFEALDALHVAKFGWLPPETEAARLEKALAAAAKDGVDGLCEVLPELYDVEYGAVRGWIKGGLLGAVLSSYLEGLPALEDCGHELRRHNLDIRTAECRRCEAVLPLVWSCKKCQGHTSDCMLGCTCVGHWCFDCGLAVKAVVSDAEIVADAVSTIRAARGDDFENETPFDLLEGADYGGWHVHEPELVTVSELLGRRRPLVEEARAPAQLPPVAPQPRVQETSSADEKWLWKGEPPELEVVRKGHMCDARRAAFVLHRAEAAGERIAPDASSVSAFYRLFHELFREDYHGFESARNCQRKALRVFGEFAQQAGAAPAPWLSALAGGAGFEVSLKALPMDVRCEIESVTRGSPVNRCTTCAKEIGADREYCSAECRGTCHCMVCYCGVEVICKACFAAQGRGQKRPAEPAVTKRVLDVDFRPRLPAMIPVDLDAVIRDNLRRFLVECRENGTEPTRENFPWFAMPWQELLEQLERDPPLQYVPNPRYVPPQPGDERTITTYKCNLCSGILVRKIYKDW